MRRPDARGWYAVVAAVFFVVADNINFLTRALRAVIQPLADLGVRNVLQVVLCFSVERTALPVPAVG